MVFIILFLFLSMCYSNSSISSNIELGKKYGKKVDSSISEIPQYFSNGFQFPIWRIITDAPCITPMKWGLIPHWFQGNPTEIASKTLNARIESISSKPSFSKLIESNRCIIPSSGFFEWQHQGKNKIPHFIYGKEDSILSMAGLWDEYVDASTGILIQSFTILTQEANAFMAEIHNVKKRMPVFLKDSAISGWLNGKQFSLIDFDNNAISLNAHPVDKSILLSANSNVSESQLLFSPASTQYSVF